MRQEPEFFGDQELVLVFVAKRLKEALAFEKAFDEDALDYTVVPTPFVSGLPFPFQRVPQAVADRFCRGDALERWYIEKDGFLRKADLAVDQDAY